MNRQYSSQRAIRFSEFAFWDRRSNFWEVALVASILAAILFNLVIGPLTPIIIILSLPAFMILRWEMIPGLLRSSWPLLLIPGFAIASTLWSDLPGTTARYSVLYLLTAMSGVIMGGAFRPPSVLVGMFIAFFLYGILTFLSFRFVSWSGPGGLAFAGLAGSKNAAGDIAALTLLTAAATIALGASERKARWVTLSLLLLPVALFCLWASHATAALISCFLALSCMMLWWASRALSYQTRVLILLVMIFAIGLALATLNLWLPPLFDLVLAESGKDADLTGRIDLWRKSDELIARRPWLGVGYNAFWVHGNLDAEALWRLLGISTRSGFNFHNTPREVLVHLGVVGLILFTTVALIGVFRLFAKTMAQPTPGLIYQCSLIVFFLPKLPFEVIGFGTMHFSTISFYAILGAGYRTFRRENRTAYAPAHSYGRASR
jgi:exopolysaccharide production protein ExoQ